ncbi:hypothetical protein Scep_012040 [Stephania cephalantha]|uniref:Uncharacterized protein n=1 Tax=Stephania cephalantha TaxID=152367 RepID=A0AAP0JGJ0_9MAGN
MTDGRISSIVSCKAHDCLRKVSIFRPKPPIFNALREISKQTLDMNSILFAAKPDKWKSKQTKKQDVYKEFYDVFGPGNKKRIE